MVSCSSCFCVILSLCKNSNVEKARLGRHLTKYYGLKGKASVRKIYEKNKRN